MIKHLPAVQETWVQSLGQEDPLEEGMANHSSIPAWRIPGTGEPGGLPSMRLHRVGPDWSDLAVAAAEFSSVAQLCPTLCDPMNYSTPGLPAHPQVPEFTQTHVHWVGDAIQLILCCPLLLLPSIFPSIRVFSKESVLYIKWPNIGAPASASVLPMNIQDWFPLGLTGLISCQSKGLSRVSPIPQFKSINPLVLSFLYGPTLTSVHDHWKKHSLD